MRELITQKERKDNKQYWIGELQSGGYSLRKSYVNNLKSRLNAGSILYEKSPHTGTAKLREIS